MSRRGFFFGLLTGIIVMGLLMAIAGFVIFLARWPQGHMLPLHGRSFGFGLPRRSFGYGSVWRPFGLGAFLCGAALLLVLGGFLLLALIGRRWRWHHPKCPLGSDQEKPRGVKTTETGNEPAAKGGDTGAGDHRAET